MKKMLLMAAMVTVLATSGLAVNNLWQGTSEIGGGGLLDFTSINGRVLSLSGQYGYFVIDLLEVAGRVRILDNDNETLWSFGPRAEYNFETETDVIPYVGVSLEFGHAKYQNIDDAEEKNCAIFGGQLGIKFFVTDNLSIVPAIEGEVATTDFFARNDELEAANATVTLATRYFF